MTTAILATILAPTFALVPYSYLDPMDGYPDPAGVQQVESGELFAATLKSRDFDTFIETTNQQTSLHPSISHGVVVVATRSGVTQAESGSNSNGVYTLSHSITALTIHPSLQYLVKVDDYNSVDQNSNLTIKDIDFPFTHTVRINNPNYVPPGCGGDN